jgi:hypothetical protein
VILAEIIMGVIYHSYQFSLFPFSIMLFRVGLNYNIALTISKKSCKNYSSFLLVYNSQSQKLGLKKLRVHYVQKY